nr:ABC-F type ribosomal protection protein [Mammaliicoccus lentus]
MLLLEAFHIKHYVQDRLLLDISHLHVHKNDRIGLVGRNGNGKTTLLEILSKTISPEKGTVTQYSTCELIPQLKQVNSTKSGGELTKTYIQKALDKKPNLLLADEPTTNLDTSSIEALEGILNDWNGAFIIVSHDRAFLDSLCTSIWEIDDGIINIYQGNYSNFIKQKERLRKEQEREYEKYVTKKQQLKTAVELTEQRAQRATKKPKNVSASEARIKGVKTHYANKQKKLRSSSKALEKRIEQLPSVERPKDSPPIQMNLVNEDTLQGRFILQMDDVIAKVGGRILWRINRLDVKSGDKIALIGDIGSGKTTFVKKILQQANGITISPAVKIGYFSQNLDVLNENQTILENVSSTSTQSETLIRIILARLHFFRDDVYKQVKVLSGGERVKVALAKLFVSNVNFLILDEPTNHLDIESVQALEELLNSYKGTILLVSHDRYFIEKIADRIMEIKNKKINVFEGTYQQFKLETPKTSQEKNIKKDKKLLLETRISEVLSRLSIEPSEELEKEFQTLLKEKNKLD